MMQSMTGFGKAVCELPNKIINIEVKSLNSKQLDIYTRLPNLYRDKDLEFRNLVSKNLIRGKVEFTITYENKDTSSTAKINIPQVKEYYRQLNEISKELEIQEDSFLQTIMRFPESLKIDKEELDADEWILLKNKTQEALDSINEFRAQEGLALEQDIIERVDTIAGQLKQIEPHEEARMQHMREKISNNLEEGIDRDKIDDNRFEQELIFYMEKMDITEEKVRLLNHCEFFKEVSGESNVIGKKLSFISQEMGREINTIGSKANHSDIQRIVVGMKDELEKIKEQLMNVL